MEKTGIGPVVGIIILIVVLVVGGVYFFLKEQARFNTPPIVETVNA